MIERIVISLYPWWQTVHIVAYLMGIFLVVAGLVAFASVGRIPHMGASKPGAIAVSSTLAGVMLLSLPQLLDTLNYTIFTNAPEGFISYSLTTPGVIAAKKMYAQYRIFSLAVIKLLGLIAVIYGTTLLAGSSQRPTQLGRGIFFWIAGCLSLNIEKIMLAIGASVGGTFDTIIQKFLT